eukprot:CAMPEP_0119118870 /NCGR_PEP_ID=MMETSP1310-20130426/602_1 /TAXON_ID=464262 /ORGANISM="Genus nov. species nov., Strain RCC2339" /LENGTH=153 /DNA_ID=CAMNT_0007108269 /DNA_START=69 /DNA_END=530 /DNA_ORIENTATION=-
MCEFLSCEWQGKAGHMYYDICECEPCCGEPCNPADGVKCFLCWCCPIVSCFSAVKLYSYSMDQNCALVNHCCIMCIPYVGGIIFNTPLRHNLRVKNGTEGSVIGDCLASTCCCCACCSGCQNLRSVDVDAWSWWEHMDEFGVFEDPCKCCIDA